MSDHEAHQPPTPDPALRRLDVLVGTWELDGKTLPEFPGPPMTVSGTYSFEWLHGGFFLVQRWDTVFGDPSDGPREELPGGAVQKGIMFYGYDADSGKYRTHFFDGNGPFHEGSIYEGDIVDGKLTFVGPAQFTVVPNDDGTITSDWEMPGEDGTYVAWQSIRLTRIS